MLFGTSPAGIPGQRAYLFIYMRNISRKQLVISWLVFQMASKIKLPYKVYIRASKTSSKIISADDIISVGVDLSIRTNECLPPTKRRIFNFLLVLIRNSYCINQIPDNKWLIWNKHNSNYFFIMIWRREILQYNQGIHILAKYGTNTAAINGGLQKKALQRLITHYRK